MSTAVMVPEVRDRGCGRATVVGTSSQGRRFFRFKCNCWDCSFCAPRKAARYKRAITREAERLKLSRFLTLTLDPKTLPDQCDPVEWIRESYNKLRVYLGRRFKGFSYICVLEFHKSGLPHLHILISHYVEWRWIQRAWMAVGGGRSVDIKHVDVHRVSAYVSKYLTKEMLTRSPGGVRRVTVSRGVSLKSDTKKIEGETWMIITRPIEELLREFLGFDAEQRWLVTGELMQFEVPPI